MAEDEVVGVEMQQGARALLDVAVVVVEHMEIWWKTADVVVVVVVAVEL